MKTCPYCAEEIKDAAIKCRWCLSWLVDDVPRAAATPPAGVMETSPVSTAPLPGAGTSGAAASPQERVEFTHSGERYLLGFGADYFGIWDRRSPDAPFERFPRNDDGWRAAWERYTAIEKNYMDLRASG